MSYYDFITSQTIKKSSTTFLIAQQVNNICDSFVTNIINRGYLTIYIRKVILITQNTLTVFLSFLRLDYLQN